MLRIRGLNHSFFWFRRKPSGFFALEVHYVLMRLASSMVTGFGVVFVYELGNSLRSGLLWVGGFYVVQRLMVALSLGMLARLVEKIGYRKLMFWSIIGMIAKLWLLSISSVTGWMYLLGAVFFGGLSLAGYTIVFHGMFLDDNDDERIGEQLGLLTTLSRASGIVAPFFAGLIIENFGFSWMFLVAMGLLMLSTVPLWMMPHHKHKKNVYDFSKVMRLYNEYRKFSLSAFFWYVTDAVQWLIWPVYLFLILKDYEVFGVVGSLVMIFNSVAAFVAGRMYDKKPYEKAFPAFSLIVAITWVMRFLSKDILTVSTSDAINRFVSPFWWMKIRRDELGIGEKFDSVVFSVAHEYLLTLAYLLTLIVSITVLYITQKFEWLIVLTVIPTILSSYLLLMDRKKFYEKK